MTMNSMHMVLVALTLSGIAWSKRSGASPDTPQVSEGFEQKSVAELPEAPSARAVITKKTLRFAPEWQPVILKEFAKISKLPPIEGTDGMFSYQANIELSNPSMEGLDLAFAPDEGMKLYIGHFSVDAQANMAAAGVVPDTLKAMGVPEKVEITPKLTAKLEVYNARVKLHIRLKEEVDESGETKRVLHVEFKEDELDFTFVLADAKLHGDAGGAGNSIISHIWPSVEGKVRELMVKEVQTVTKTLVDTELTNFLKKINLKFEVNLPEPYKSKQIALEPTAIQITENYMAMDFTTKFGAKVDAMTKSVQTRMPLPFDQDEVDYPSKMFFLTIAPDLFESMVSYQKERLSHVLKKDDLKDSPIPITTGGLRMATVPFLTTVYGRQDMQIRVSLYEEMILNFHDYYVDVTMPARLDFEVLKNGSDPEVAFSMGANVSSNITGGIVNDGSHVSLSIEGVNVEGMRTIEKSNSLWWVNTWTIGTVVNLVEWRIQQDLEQTLAINQMYPVIEGIVSIADAHTRFQDGGFSLYADLELAQHTAF